MLPTAPGLLVHSSTAVVHSSGTGYFWYVPGQCVAQGTPERKLSLLGCVIAQLGPSQEQKNVCRLLSGGHHLLHFVCLLRGTSARQARLGNGRSPSHGAGHSGVWGFFPSWCGTGALPTEKVFYQTPLLKPPWRHRSQQLPSERLISPNSHPPCKWKEKLSLPQRLEIWDNIFSFWTISNTLTWIWSKVERESVLCRLSGFGCPALIPCRKNHKSCNCHSLSEGHFILEKRQWNDGN